MDLALKISTAREFLPTSLLPGQAKWPILRAGMATEEADGRPCSPLVLSDHLAGAAPILPRESRFFTMCNVETRECDSHVKPAGSTSPPPPPQRVRPGVTPAHRSAVQSECAQQTCPWYHSLVLDVDAAPSGWPPVAVWVMVRWPG
jgi:hypothetical protein